MNFIADLALEYRLSLDNLCKLLGREITEANKMELYEMIRINVVKGNPELLKKYNYLFFYETLNEPQSISKLSYITAYNFILRCKRLKEAGNEELLKEKVKELRTVDLNFKNIKNTLKDKKLTEEDMMILSKYRIKHVISKASICEMTGISSDTFYRHEKLITSNYITHKLNVLSEYQLEFANRKLRKK